MEPSSVKFAKVKVSVRNCRGNPNCPTEGNARFSLTSPLRSVPLPRLVDFFGIQAFLATLALKPFLTRESSRLNVLPPCVPELDKPANPLSSFRERRT